MELEETLDPPKMLNSVEEMLVNNANTIKILERSQQDLELSRDKSLQCLKEHHLAMTAKLKQAYEDSLAEVNTEYEKLKENNERREKSLSRCSLALMPELQNLKSARSDGEIQRSKDILERMQEVVKLTQNEKKITFNFVPKIGKLKLGFLQLCGNLPEDFTLQLLTPINNITTGKQVLCGIEGKFTNENLQHLQFGVRQRNKTILSKKVGVEGRVFSFIFTADTSAVYTVMACLFGHPIAQSPITISINSLNSQADFITCQGTGFQGAPLSRPSEEITECDSTMLTPVKLQTRENSSTYMNKINKNGTADDGVDLQQKDANVIKGDKKSVQGKKKKTDDNEEMGDMGLAGADSARWKDGDFCIARWEEDGIWYNGKIEALNTDGSFIVNFIDYGNSAVVQRPNIVKSSTEIPDTVPDYDIDENVGSRSRNVPQNVEEFEVLKGNGQQTIETHSEKHDTYIDAEEQGPILDDTKLTDQEHVKAIFRPDDTCVAKWSEDEVWYNAIVQSVNADGSYIVLFIDYGNTDTVQKSFVIGNTTQLPKDDVIDENVDVNIVQSDKNNAKVTEIGTNNAEEIKILEQEQNNVRDKKPVKDAFQADDVCVVRDACEIQVDDQIDENIKRTRIRSDKNTTEETKLEKETGIKPPSEHTKSVQNKSQDNVTTSEDSQAPRQRTISASGIRMITNAMNKVNHQRLNDEKSQIRREGPSFASESDDEMKKMHPNFKHKESLHQNAIEGPNVGMTRLNSDGHTNEIDKKKKRDKSKPPVPRRLKTPNSHVDKKERSDSKMAKKETVWKLGDICLAQWSSDDVWYNAVVTNKSLSENGNGEVTYTVSFSDYGNTDQVGADRIVESHLDLISSGIPVVLDENIKIDDSAIAKDYGDIPKNEFQNVDDNMNVEAVGGATYQADAAQIVKTRDYLSPSQYPLPASTSKTPMEPKKFSYPLAQPGRNSDIASKPNISTPKAESIPLPDQKQKINFLREVATIPNGTPQLVAKSVSNITKNISSPIGITVLKNKNFLISNSGEDSVIMFNPEGKLMARIKSVRPFKRPTDMTTLSTGEFVVRDDAGLQLFGQNGEFIKVLGENQIDQCFGVSEDEEGRILTINKSKSKGKGGITDAGETDIFFICPKSGVVVKRIELTDIIANKSRSKCRFLNYRNHTIYIVDLGLDCIYKLTVRNEPEADIIGKTGSGPGQLRDPAGLVIDHFGNFIVADSLNHRLQIFNKIGNFVGLVKVDVPVNRPSGIYLDQDLWELYVLNYWGNSMTKYRIGIKTGVHL